MLCEKCGKREATTYFKQTVNGKTTVWNVCPECAEELGLTHLFQGFNFNIGDVFGGLLGNLSAKASSALPKGQICPECHSSLNKIIQSGKLGCPKCYAAFRRELLPTIEQLHGKVNHQGKLPRSAGALARKKAQLSSLKQQLEEAIQRQDFENAAKYRDQIQELEKGENQNGKMV